jgi:hypothetical protein
VWLRLAYLGITNALTMLRLLPMSDRDKDAKILALRHQVTVLERQLGKQKIRFDPTDRAFLAALLHRLPMQALRELQLLVRPDTVLRWHRDLIARRHASACRPKDLARPRTAHSIRALVLRLAAENSSWGYRRVHGELLVLGVKVAASTVWEILHEAGIDPAPQRTSTTWAGCSRAIAAHSGLWCERGDRGPQQPPEVVLVAEDGTEVGKWVEGDGTSAAWTGGPDHHLGVGEVAPRLSILFLGPAVPSHKARP